MATTASTFEQFGVATSLVNNTTVHTPWIEFFGDQQAGTGKKGPDCNQTNLPSNYVAHAGDSNSVSVSLVAGTNNEFRFQMKDATGTGWTYSVLQTMT
jgi:hypothetical protein